MMKRNFVNENIDLIDDYEINKIYDKIIVKKFKKETNFFLEENMNKFEIRSIGFTFEKFKNYTYKDLSSAYHNFVYKEQDLHIFDLNLKYHFSMLFNNYLFGDLNIQKSFIEFNRLREYGLDLFIDFLDYVINDRINENLAKANEIKDKYEIRDFFDYTEIEELGNIQIKKFKNGKIRIKGLTQNQIDKIIHVKSLY